MPSINVSAIPIADSDEMIVSPISSAWVFDASSSIDTNSEEERRSSDMDTPISLLSHHRRSFRNLSRFVRLRQLTRQRQENGQVAPLHIETLATSPYCLSHQDNFTPYSSSPQSTSPFHSCFLDFRVAFNDGGCYSPEYAITNVLKNDSSVYCSGRTGAVNLLLEYCGGRVLMDTSCVLNKIIIRSPYQGFTAPCKEGLVFLSHHPINIKRTSRFDAFTKSDYDAYSNSGDLSNSDQDPIAWFNITNSSQYVIPLNQRSGKYVLIKLLRSECEEQDNIDLQYIGFVGYTGSRSFASPPHLC